MKVEAFQKRLKLLGVLAYMYARNPRAYAAGL